jgi:hypothetical protein
MVDLCKGKKAGFLFHISSKIYDCKHAEIEQFIRSVYSDVRVQQPIAFQQQ